MELGWMICGEENRDQYTPLPLYMTSTNSNFFLHCFRFLKSRDESAYESLIQHSCWIGRGGLRPVFSIFMIDIQCHYFYLRSEEHDGSFEKSNVSMIRTFHHKT